MPGEIGTDEIRNLLEQPGAQLLEVLPKREYEELHLPGAINVPLKSLDASTVQDLDPAQPTIVYCWDYQ